jgi:hypothetical protein
MKKEQETGLAPTMETISDFYGIAEQVVADSKKTKFINPQNMVHYDDEGNVTYDPVYTSMVEFLETELKEKKATEDANYIGTLRKRLSALKANMVDYLVGGITISDRNSTKDLVEDAIKNCASAAKDGWGRAANYEGLSKSYKLLTSKLEQFKSHFATENINVAVDILKTIFYSYFQTTKDLYSTVATEDEAIDITAKSLTELDGPVNIKAGFLTAEIIYSKNHNVKCTISLDTNILTTICKIISLMVTCNQCLLQAPQLNKY